VALLESVPNFSEGRDASTIAAIGEAIAARARLLDVHSDPDHNRSVFTLVGEEGELVEALLAAVSVARERIDLSGHAGAHPRIGAADVLPVVPLDPGDAARAHRVVQDLGVEIGLSGLPVFVYAPPERGPAFYRQGGVAELQRRVDDGEIVPDFGPSKLDPTAGGVILGVRRPLIAFNVNLHGSLAAAREIAGVVRERGGGFHGVRALGLDLPTAGLVQVSMNIEDWPFAPPYRVVERIRVEAAARGAEFAGYEVVGLLPAGAAVGLEGLDPSRILETRLT
jgi:glutamate formiminotransferase / 5-formyltetrahydrofolate cyclo-ligase